MPVKFPRPFVADYRRDDGMDLRVTEYDEVYRDPRNLSVRTSGQDREIKRLEEQLAEKNAKRSSDLQNVIAYFYKRK